MSVFVSRGRSRKAIGDDWQGCHSTPDGSCSFVAADPTGDPGLIWRAADSLHIAEDAAEAIEDHELVEFREHVVFRHPLVGLAVYNTAAPKEKREAHAALAGATDRAV